MKKIYTTLVIALLSINVFGQAPNWAWAKSAGGSSGDVGWDIAVDGSGNSYVTGWFGSSSITFGATTLTDTAIAITTDMFIAKYDASGNVVWAKSAGDIGSAWGCGIAVDSSGNCYVTGYFGNTTINFGSIILTSTGGLNPFIVKYDASGNVLWAKSGSGSVDDRAARIAIDRSGNSYVTGTFKSSTITFGSTTLTNAGGSSSNDIFVVKYDSNGNVMWAKSAGGNNEDYGNSITVDGTGNSYVTGWFMSPTITFGTITLSNVGSAGSTDMFIAKYDSSGNVVWAIRLGGSGGEGGYGIAVDGNSNIYLTGSFTSPTITFGSTTLSNSGSVGTNDCFIVKYDSIGNAIWAKRAGGYLDEYGFDIAVDNSGNSYVTGYFFSTGITFGTTTLLNAGNSGTDDMFVVKYDASGNLMWAKRIGGSGYDQGQGIAVDGSGTSYVTGLFSSSPIAFGTTTLTNAGADDMFVAKLNNSMVTTVKEEKDGAGLTIYPNPFTSQTTIAFSEEQKHTTIKIMNVVGKEIKTVNFSGKKLIIEKGEMSNGIYFVRIEDVNKNVVNRKIVVQ